MFNDRKLLLNSSNGLESFGICPEMLSDVIIEWTFTEVSIFKKLQSNKENYFSGSFIGSSHFLGDEGFIFDPLTLKLQSIYLIAPENNFSGNEILKYWLNSPVFKGIPIIEFPRKFSIESPLDYRYFSTKDNSLLCISGDYCNVFPSNCNRLRVHPVLELLCVDEFYIGYILKNSIYYLTRFSGEDRIVRIDKENSILSGCLSDFLSIIHEDNFEKLEQKDQFLKNKLVSLINVLQELNLSCESKFALIDRCKALLEDYFL